MNIDLELFYSPLFCVLKYTTRKISRLVFSQKKIAKYKRNMREIFQ